MNWNTRRYTITALLWFAAAVLLILIVWGLLAYGVYGPPKTVISYPIERSRLSDRRGNVGIATNRTLEQYQLYADAIHDDFDGLKSDIDERLAVIESKLKQLEDALAREKQRSTERYNSIWQEYGKLRKKWGGCR